MKIKSLVVASILLIGAGGYYLLSQWNTRADSSAVATADTIILLNQGGSMEGHTPRGFQGMGTGLFVGDNLNENFPEGDGVQLFLLFDLTSIPKGKVESAVLQSLHATVRGTPFLDLGNLRAQEIRYDSFSSELWDSKAGDEICTFAMSIDSPFACDLAGAVQRALDDEYPYAQFRLLFDKAGDGDGEQDMVMFYIQDTNTNEEGIFELHIAMTPEA